MNTNSNTYTVIYSIILVVVVAAVLAFAAMFLKPTQEANVKKDTIGQILTAATVQGEDILATYQQEIEAAILVDINGNKVGELSIEDCEVYDNAGLKKQTIADEKALPVYIFKNGITVVPCYGAGLWGPVWGYVGVNSDLVISKACFGHKSETPGLGAKIADVRKENDEKPVFSDLFTGKKFNEEIKVGKGVNPENKAEINAVDAISGATITSNATGVMINKWREFYQNYFNTIKVNDTPIVIATDSVAVCDSIPAVVEPINKEEE